MCYIILESRTLYRERTTRQIALRMGNKIRVPATNAGYVPNSAGGQIKNNAHTIVKNLLNFFVTALVKVLFQNNLFQNTLNEQVKKSVDHEYLLTVLSPAKVANLKDSNLFSYPEKGLDIRFEKQDKDYGYFHFSKPLAVETFCSTKDLHYGELKPSGSINLIGDASLAIIKPFLEALWALKIVSRVSVNHFQINVRKTGALQWNDVKEQIADAIASCFETIETEKQPTVEVTETIEG